LDANATIFRSYCHNNVDSESKPPPSLVLGREKDPVVVKDKIFQRLMMKMGKTFGDDSATL